MRTNIANNANFVGGISKENVNNFNENRWGNAFQLFRRNHPVLVHQFPQLVHERLVDLEATGGIDEQHVVEPSARGLQGCASNGKWVLPPLGIMKIGPDLLRESLQLQNRSRSTHVGADEQDALFLRLN